MKRTLMLAAGLLTLLATPAAAQTRADSVNTELVRLRGFIRAAETQATKALEALLPLTTPAPAPPTVQDWRTGEWDVLAAGYRGTIDLTRMQATSNGATAPILATAHGDTLRVRLDIPGYTQMGLIELVHAEGRMIGTVTRDTIVRPASAQRLELRVVRTVRRQPCTFAEYTDGSWGVAPHNADCHQALDAYAGPLRFVARQYVP